MIEALWVFEVPMSLPIDARLPEAQLKAARQALARAKAVGEEYEGVEVATATVRARRAGQAIVEEARRRGVEAIVLAAEEPSRIRGGALLGGRGARWTTSSATSRSTSSSKAPCRVILTAPPAKARDDAPPEDHGVPPPLGTPSCARGRVRAMFVLIVGAGRVGSAVAKSALAAGHEVSVLDEDPLSHERLDEDQRESWEDAGGQFTVGTALEIDALIEAGIERADVFIASTDGDNTNLVIAQIAQKRFDVPKVIVRVMDPRARRVVRRAGPADDLPDPGGDRDVRGRGPRRRGRGELMYVVVAGAGKVGWNLARELIDKGHEVTLIESSRGATWSSSRSSSTPSSTATRPSCGCSSGRASSAPTS